MQTLGVRGKTGGQEKLEAFARRLLVNFASPSTRTWGAIKPTSQTSVVCLLGSNHISYISHNTFPMERGMFKLFFPI